MNCNQTTNTPINQEEDPCGGLKKSSKCVVQEGALTGLNLPANSSQNDINNALQNAIETLTISQEEITETIYNDLKVTLTSNQVRTLSTQPLELLIAQGAGTIIEVTSAFYKMDYNTEDFTSNKLILSGSYEMEAIGIDTSSDKFKYFRKVSDVATNNELQENTALTLTADSDSLQGDSPITIYITYRIKQL